MAYFFNGGDMRDIGHSIEHAPTAVMAPKNGQ
jgi:hypothetical protein